MTDADSTTVPDGTPSLPGTESTAPAGPEILDAEGNDVSPVKLTAAEQKRVDGYQKSVDKCQTAYDNQAQRVAGLQLVYDTAPSTGKNAAKKTLEAAIKLQTKMERALSDAKGLIQNVIDTAARNAEDAKAKKVKADADAEKKRSERALTTTLERVGEFSKEIDVFNLRVLTDAERTERNKLEAEIKSQDLKRVNATIAIANALLKIKDKGLYQDTIGGFGEYCKQTFGFGRTSGGRYIDFAKMTASLENLPEIKALPAPQDAEGRGLSPANLPTTEVQVRELRKAGNEADQHVVWFNIVKAAANDDDLTVSGPVIAKFVEDYKAKKEGRSTAAAESASPTTEAAAKAGKKSKAVVADENAQLAEFSKLGLDKPIAIEKFTESIVQTACYHGHTYTITERKDEAGIATYFADEVVSLPLALGSSPDFVEALRSVQQAAKLADQQNDAEFDGKDAEIVEEIVGERDPDADVEFPE